VVGEDRLTSDPIMQRHLRNVQGLNEGNDLPTFDFGSFADFDASQTMTGESN
jgi:hypothetical protein